MVGQHGDQGDLVEMGIFRETDDVEQGYAAEPEMGNGKFSDELVDVMDHIVAGGDMERKRHPGGLGTQPGHVPGRHLCTEIAVSDEQIGIRLRRVGQRIAEQIPHFQPIGADLPADDYVGIQLPDFLQVAFQPLHVCTGKTWNGLWHLILVKTLAERVPRPSPAANKFALIFHS